MKAAWSWAWPYAVAVLAVGMTLGLKGLMPGLLVMRSPFLLLLGAVMIAAAIGGRGPGLLATILAAVGTDLLFLPPRFTLFGPDDGLVVLFLLEGALISIVSEQLRRLRQTAVAATKARDELMAILAHDLRNPLGVVKGGIDLLRETLPQPRAPDVDELLDVIDRSTGVMSGLITDLLDVAKIDNGALTVTPALTNLVELVRQSVEAQSVGAAQLTFKLTVEGDAAAACARAEVDPLRLRQALGNLLGNAAKFTPAGGVVGVTLAEADGWARLVVADNGPGIARELIPVLFDRYRQGATAKAGSGAGLGLYIARGIVEGHGGRIRVKSQVGLGTAFTIELPLRTRGNPGSVRRAPPLLSPAPRS